MPASLFPAVNPKLIKDYGHNSLRKVKTDKADAKKIASYTLDNWLDLRQYTGMDTLRKQLKTMNTQLDFFTKQKTAAKNNLIRPFGSDLSWRERLLQQPGTQ